MLQFTNPPLIRPIPPQRLPAQRILVSPLAWHRCQRLHARRATGSLKRALPKRPIDARYATVTYWLHANQQRRKVDASCQYATSE
jgi:hypothetical protein